MTLAKLTDAGKNPFLTLGKHFLLCFFDSHPPRLIILFKKVHYVLPSLFEDRVSFFREKVAMFGNRGNVKNDFLNDFQRNIALSFYGILFRSWKTIMLIKRYRRNSHPEPWLWQMQLYATVMKIHPKSGFHYKKFRLSITFYEEEKRSLTLCSEVCSIQNSEMITSSFLNCIKAFLSLTTPWNYLEQNKKKNKYSHSKAMRY